jgi:prophage regulatory protein
VTDDMYLRIKQVTAVTGLSRATIYNMMAAGNFPMRTALGDRAVGWLSSEVQRWMAERKLVEKKGIEANPARRKIAYKASVVPGAAKTERKPAAQAAQGGSKQTKWSDWEDNSVPTAAERQSTSDRLRLINAMKRQREQKGMIVKARSKTFTIIGGSAQSTSVGDRSDACDLSTPSAKRKT